MTNNQSSSNFIAVRVALAAIIAGVCLGLITIGTGAQKRTTDGRDGVIRGGQDRTGTPDAPTVLPTFTAGNLVVEKVGDGTNALSSSAFPLALVEYTTAGTLVQTISLPNAVSRPSANPFNLMDQGSSTSAGQITRAANGHSIVVMGYNAITGDATPSSSSTATIVRTIGVISAGGAVDTSRGINMFSGNSFRALASSNGQEFWGGGNGGINYISSGGTVTTLTATFSRVLNIFNNTLYSSNQNGLAATGVYQLGTAGTLPTAAAPTETLIIPISTGTGTPSPYGFSINPGGNIAYVSDDRAVASGGGVNKYTLVSGTWTFQYTLSLGTTGARGLVVDWSGANPIIYGTTTETNANRIVTITDTGVASVVSTVATAAANFAFRGITFSPLTSSAADVSIGGRVTTAGGRGIRGARVTVRGNSLSQPIVTTTGAMGAFSVTGLTSGETYVVTVNAKRFTFQAPSQVITLNDNLFDVNFVSN